MYIIYTFFILCTIFVYTFYDVSQKNYFYTTPWELHFYFSKGYWMHTVAYGLKPFTAHHWSGKQREQWELRRSDLHTVYPWRGVWSWWVGIQVGEHHSHLKITCRIFQHSSPSDLALIWMLLYGIPILISMGHLSYTFFLDFLAVFLFLPVDLSSYQLILPYFF